jgi:hypothetical protein
VLNRYLQKRKRCFEDMERKGVLFNPFAARIYTCVDVKVKIVLNAREFNMN